MGEIHVMESARAAHSVTMLMVAANPAPLARTESSGVRHRAVHSFDDVYEQHFDFVWRSVRRLGVPDGSVDDVAQEIFIVVHRKLSEFEGRSTVKTWLFAIARRVVSDHRRRLKRRRAHTPLYDKPVACAGDNPQESAARLQAAQLLHAFLDSLADEQREVFVLAELEQMTAPEIAEATGTKLNTVYSRLRLARKAFERAVTRHRARARRAG